MEGLRRQPGSRGAGFLDSLLSSVVDPTYEESGGAGPRHRFFLRLFLAFVRLTKSPYIPYIPKMPAFLTIIFPRDFSFGRAFFKLRVHFQKE
jgi:hypothetical protein